MLGKESSLYSLGDFKFLGDAALGLRFLGAGTALCLDGVGDLVKADQRERVAVEIFEAGKDSTPDGRVVAFDDRATACGLDASQLGHGEELDAAPRPLPVFGDDVVGDKDDLGAAADQVVLLGSGFGCDEGDDGFSVGRSDRQPTFARLQNGVGDEAKAELVEIEAQGLLL